MIQPNSSRSDSDVIEAAAARIMKSLKMKSFAHNNSMNVSNSNNSRGKQTNCAASPVDFMCVKSEDLSNFVVRRMYDRMELIVYTLHEYERVDSKSCYYFTRGGLCEWSKSEQMVR